MQFCNCEHLHFLFYIKLSITISCKCCTIYKGDMLLSDYPIFQVLDMKFPVLGRGQCLKSETKSSVSSHFLLLTMGFLVVQLFLPNGNDDNACHTPPPEWPKNQTNNNTCESMRKTIRHLDRTGQPSHCGSLSPKELVCSHCFGKT